VLGDHRLGLGPVDGWYRVSFSGVSTVPSGITPFSIIRASTHSR